MTPCRAVHPSREDVLNAFSVEPRPDRETLERYLRAYPDYAADLVDLSRELARDPCEDDAPLSAEEKALIDAACTRHSASASRAPANPFAALSTADLREISRRLDLPRQVLTAFRERRVILSSVPRRFLARLADALNSSLDALEALWAEVIPAPIPARSYKADHKPPHARMITFEQVLVEAGVPDDKRAKLMADAD